MNNSKKYKLLDFNITVTYVKNDTLDDHWVFGHTKYDANDVEIVISTYTESGRKFTKEELSITLRHELYHVIFAKLYFTNNEENETLVEWLAQATNILNKQGLKI